MRGVILCGGNATRLYPLTALANKHLLPIYNKPMVYFPIEMLKQCGVDNILIIVGGNDIGDFLKLLGDGEGFGVAITYKYQSSASGIAHALKLAKDFVGNNDFIVCLGDNIFQNYMPDIVDKFNHNRDITVPTGMIFISPTNKPGSFGVPTFSDDGLSIVKITEKPQFPDSNFAVTGLYVYDFHIWETLDTLKPSGRGEFEITDVNNYYINNGILKNEKVVGWWKDCGSFDSLLEAGTLVASGEKQK